MSTSNLVVTSQDWSKVADADDTDFLVTWRTAKIVEFASTEFDGFPDVSGHTMSRDKEVTRETVGAGFVWARLVPDGSKSFIQLAVSKTKSASGATGGYDIAEGVHKVAMMSWNSGTLQWERSAGNTGGVTEANVLPAFTKRFEVVSELLIYVGQAAVGVVESSTGWTIKKIMFDGLGNPTAVRLGTGSWTNRNSVTYQ